MSSGENDVEMMDVASVAQLEQALKRKSIDFVDGPGSHQRPKVASSDSDGDSDAEPGFDSDSDILDGNNDNDEDALTTEARRLTRAQQKAKFESWWAERAFDIQSNPRRQLEGPQDNELVSVRSLLSNTTRQIISDAREYQLELFDKAKQQNTIAVLDTGSGKTLIATLLIRWMLEQELEQRAKGGKPRICVFLVNSVTLVFQQAAVLECNLDATVGKYCGEMGTDLWTRDQWQAKVAVDKIFVATADTIFNCLTHSFINMSDISLLIFDECHHAKKSHAYARIMRQFYEPAKAEDRPRIFGMTASPVDARVDVVKAAQQLERLLHSRICTTSDMSLLQKIFTKPKEHILGYPPLVNPPTTELNQKLSAFKGAKCLSPVFRFIDVAAYELGPWCTDIIWSLSLTELEASRQERRAGSKNPITFRRDEDDGTNSSEYLPITDKETMFIKEARKIVENHNFNDSLPADLTLALSPKLYILLSYLDSRFEASPDMKCIVFVTRRYTAKCIELLFQKRAHKNIRLGTLFGTSGFQIGNDQMTFRQQTLTLHRFRKGNLNCLIATAVAEEGLDIPDCNLVIRFDLYTTMIQYIQSRGRARHHASEYIHMAEQNNPYHKQAVLDGREAEKVMKEFCQKLPEDRLLDRNYDDFAEADPIDSQAYCVTETGAKLTLNSSMQILNRFVDRLGAEEGMVAERAIYLVEPLPSQGFRCEIKLPETSPVRSIEAMSTRSKSQAKQLAAFEACKILHQRGLLDNYLMPIYVEKVRPMMANAHLAVDSHRTNSYPSRMKPTFWERKEPPVPRRLWATSITLRTPEQLGKTSQGICMLTREKPPHFPSFPLYFDRGGESLVDCVTMEEPLYLEGDRIDKLNRFTSRFFLDIFNKEFEITTVALPYWILPIKFNKTVSPQSSIDDMVDWNLVDYVQTTDEIPFDIASMPAEFYIGKFVIDRRQGSRRFYILEHAPQYHPYDPIPDGGANAPHTYNIIDYSYSAGKKGWQRWAGELPPNQPVLLAERVLHRLNCLDKPTKREMTQNTAAYVVPSPFRISPLPAKFCTMGLLFPAIITRIDAYLHAYDVCNLLDAKIDLDVALEAITKDSDNTSEPTEEQVQKRRGMGNNYERLEFLGDCFLKLSTTITLFAQNPENDEFEYHVKRMLLVCNQNLFKRATELELFKYIQSEGFSRRLWYPMITLIRGKGMGKGVAERHHRLSDKSIADVCEALIGAALSNRGLNMAARVVTALLRTDQHQVHSFKDYYPLYKLPEYQSAGVTASQQDLANQIEKQLGYKFKWPRLLRSAFTHPSFPASWERIPCYERLEFLGDALIDMACVEDLWERFPSKDPQWLTEHKMSMINNRFQGALCVKLGLHRHLRAMGTHITAAVQDYVSLIDEALVAAEPGSVDYWVDVKAPPKALPDILEAYVGALFVDSEFDYNVVKAFYDNHIKPFFIDISVFDSFAGNHPVTHLSSRMQEFGCSDWRIFSKEFKDRDVSYVLSGVMFHNIVLAEGKAASSKNSRTNAARQALDKLSKMSTRDFMRTCNCAQMRKSEEEERAAEKSRKNIEKEMLKEQGQLIAAIA